MAIISGNNIMPGVRQRAGANAGVSGDLTGYGPVVYSGTASGGTPTGGTAGYGAGTLEAGALVISNGSTVKLYENTNTKASPTWTVVGGQS